MVIRWKGIDKNDSIQEHFDKKIQKLAKYKDISEEGSHLEIEVLRGTRDYHVKLTVPVNGHPKAFAEVKDANALSAINAVIDKVDEQLRKFKTIREKTKKKSHNAVLKSAE